MLALLLPALLHAQQPDSRTTGTTYVLAFPDTVTNTFDARYPNKMADKIFIYMYSPVDNNKITVTGNGYNRLLTGQAGKFTILDLTDPTFKAPTPIVTEINVASKNTFRVEAQKPIVVYCYMVTKFGCEAWTPIPIESWGKQYYAQALPGEKVNDIIPQDPKYQAKPVMAPGEILVIAAEDSTVVSISSNARLLTTSANDTVTTATVVLNKDEAYLVQSHVDTTRVNSRGDQQSDLGGTSITATKPIGVLSGNTRAMALDNISGLGENSFRNMMMEWLAPVEQHGREFVYMPTMDARRPKGTPGEDLTDKRSAEIIRVYNTSGKQTPGYQTDPATGSRINFSISQAGQFHEIVDGVPEAFQIKTDQPAQAFMNTTAVVKFTGNPYTGIYTYAGWSTYAVQMVPRERWIYSAPYFAPIHPSNMEHFINVVTDSASAKKLYWGAAGSTPTNPVLLNKPIKGTDLVWGSITVNTGLDLYITGWNAQAGRPDTSVKFYGFVYGLFRGDEKWRPNSGGEYEEYLAVAYGYPLAPSHIILRAGDSLVLDTTMGCLRMTVKATMANENPVGFRSITLDSINNAKITFVDPASPSNIIGRSKATFEVVPINSLRNATALVVITDRTNKTTRFRFNYEAEYLNVTPDNPAVVDFGEVTLNNSVRRTITLTNPLKRDVQIKALSFARGNQEFRIIKPTAAELPITLKPNESMGIEVEITPTTVNKLYEDSVKIKLECTEMKVKLQAETVSPCFYIDDYDFGVLKPDQDTTRSVQICNLGRGYISFTNPAGGDVITWLDQNFSISQADRDKLKNTILGPGRAPVDLNAPSCVTIKVAFKASQVGSYKTTARFWASTRDCRDTSIWTAVVTNAAGVAEEIKSGTTLTRIDPNPFHGTTRIEFTLGTAGHATLEVFDISGGRVATLADGEMEQGAHAAVWDASHLPAGTYYCRLMVGEWSTTQPLIVR
jgi:hypothetical protein